jgi:predicted AAA+ superfamily ATPase
LIDIDSIKEIAFRYRADVELFKKRFFVSQISFDKEPRIIVIKGFRGLGKTTALMHLMNDKSIYFSMDHAKIVNEKLYDLGKMCIESGYKVLLIDEIHRYSGWEGDLKSLHDEFKKVFFVVSGSAPLAFNPDRRFSVIDANQLSLREFVYLRDKDFGKNDSWKNFDSTLSYISNNTAVEENYAPYLLGGSTPIFFMHKENTLESVYNSILKSVREDSAFFAKVDGDYIVGMERALNIIANSKLGEFSLSSFSKMIELKKFKTYEIMDLLARMRIIRIIKPYVASSAVERAEPKILFYHPVFRQAISKKLGIVPDMGAIREELAVFAFTGRGYEVHTIKGEKKSPDYFVTKGMEKYLVEIGGNSKTAVQLKVASSMKGFQKIVLKEKQLLPLLMF